MAILPVSATPTAWPARTSNTGNEKFREWIEKLESQVTPEQAETLRRAYGQSLN